MATLAVSNVFAPNTLIQASQANQNFDDVEAFVNTNVIHKDGSIASTGTLSGPAADPVSDNQYARKRYVDVPYGYTVSTAFNIPGNTETTVTGFVSVSSRRVTMTGNGMTIVEGGLYIVGGRGEWATNTTGTRRAIVVKVNGTPHVADVFAMFGVNTIGFGAAPEGIGPIVLAPGDLISMGAAQDTGAGFAGTFRLFAWKIPGT